MTPQSGTTASTGSSPLQQLLSAIGLAPKAVAVASLPQAGESLFLPFQRLFNVSSNCFFNVYDVLS
jgi:hypothetical protein